ncbi:MAG TPA: serine/threonine-protein kinase [Drouetiella sp.]
MSQQDKSRPANQRLDETLKTSPAQNSRDTQANSINDSSDPNLISGRYRIETQIGSGGMSVVYKAHDILLNREVALKKLLSIQHGAAIARFQQEARAAAKLQSPSIVSVYDFGTETDGTPFLVMEYIDGAPLSDLIKRFHQIDWLSVVEIMEQVCEALIQAHNAGVIHRDIKPSNILVTSSSNLKYHARVVDFGIARLEAEQSITQTGEVFGSPLYMSPEQATGKKVDPRSDIYSLGCVMFEALTGQPPFTGASSLETLMMHQSEPIPTIRSTVIPMALIELTESMLEKDPQERPESCAVVLERLQTLERDPAKQVAGPRSVLAKKNSRAQKINIMASVVALSVIGAVGIFAARQFHHPLLQQTNSAGIDNSKMTTSESRQPKPVSDSSDVVVGSVPALPHIDDSDRTKIPDPKLNSMLEQARAAFAKPDLKEARRLVDAASARCEKFGTLRQVEECYEMVANFYSADDALADPAQLIRAEEAIRKALVIIENLDGRENLQYIIDMKTLATITKAKKDSLKSIGLYKDCLYLLKKTKIDNAYLEASIHHGLAIAYFDSGQRGAADSEFKICTDMFASINPDIRDIAVAYHQWSNLYSLKDAPESSLLKALGYLDKSIAVYKTLPPAQQQMGYPAALMAKARIFHRLDRSVDDVQDLYTEALKHQPIPLQVVNAKRGLGDCMSQRSDYEQAQNLYEQALALVGKLPASLQTELRENIYKSMARNAKASGNTEKAKEFSRRAELEPMAVPKQ